MNAEFFDIFGMLGFLILFICGIKIIKSKEKRIKTCGYIVILISVIGFLVDSFIVIKNYLI